MAEQKGPYDDAYDELEAALMTAPAVIEKLEAYLRARRAGAGETMLKPQLGIEVLREIQGKAVFMYELIAVCETAQSKLRRKGEES